MLRSCQQEMCHFGYKVPNKIRKKKLRAKYCQIFKWLVKQLDRSEAAAFVAVSFIMFTFSILPNSKHIVVKNPIRFRNDDGFLPLEFKSSLYFVGFVCQSDQLMPNFGMKHRAIGQSKANSYCP